MTTQSKWFGVLGVSIALCGAATTYLYAQDDLESLLEGLDGSSTEEAPATVAEPTPESGPATEPVVEPASEPEATPIAEADPVPAAEPVVEPKDEPAAEVAPAAEPVVEPVVEAVPTTEVKPAPAAEAGLLSDIENTESVAQGKHKDAELIQDIAALEMLRRESMSTHAIEQIRIARAKMSARDYPSAFLHYKNARSTIVDTPANEGLLKECDEGMAEARYRDAKLNMKNGNRDEAIRLAEEAVTLHHSRAQALLDSLKEEPSDSIRKDDSEIRHRRNDETYKTKRAEIRQRLRKARQYFTCAEYSQALEECEVILRKYPYDTEAMEMRQRIAARMQVVSTTEFSASREKMIRDVTAAWRPPYAVDSTQITAAAAGTEMKQTKAGDGEANRTKDQTIEQKLKEIVLPEVSFRPPATIVDAVDFFKQASRDYDKPDIPLEKRGVNFVLKLGTAAPATSANASSSDAFGGDTGASDPFGTDGSASAAPSASMGAVIPNFSARFVTLYDALKLVCDVTEMRFYIKDSIVMVVPKSDPIGSLITRSYNVLQVATERFSTAASELKGSGGGFADSTSDEAGGTQDWKELFRELGVEWPAQSSIKYLPTIGKLRVRNTAENLAVFEQALQELNVTPTLVEVETRFVEVSQEDLNSLGFEWLLNSDYSMNVGGKVGKALGLKEGVFGSNSTGASGSGLPSAGQGSQTTAGGGTTTGAGTEVGAAGSASTSAAKWNQKVGSNKNLGVNSFGGAESQLGSGMRYLSTEGNHISGAGLANNDQFMRINAFLGNADLSMILHMLSQRSDTDLLSAPKVVTKSGSPAVIKVVTEYIYPQDYDVTIQGSSSNGNGNGNGSSSVMAMVEPQNFTTREVGVILNVTPTVTAEGQMIELELRPQVVAEPTWKNYGTRLPYSGTTAQDRFTGIADIFTSLSTLLGNASDAIKQSLTDSALEAVDQMNQDTETKYYEVPMEQPFFSVRSIETNLSIYNGATVVMGGLITEERKSMEDKIPFLGDIPYFGRLFRSRSEWSNKRNLLVFVTARLVSPDGRSVTTGSGDSTSTAPVYNNTATP